MTHWPAADAAHGRRLLLLSYAFPPATAPEAMLSAKRAGNLPGWDVEVIAAAPFHPGMGNDPDMAAYAGATVRAIHRLKPAVRLPLHRLGALAHLPDTMRMLNGQAIRLAAALHAAQPFDAILSWSTYHSVHLAALALKRQLAVAVARAHERSLGRQRVRHLWRARPARSTGAWSARVIGTADRVLFTTPETVELVMAKYPAGLARDARRHPARLRRGRSIRRMQPPPLRRAPAGGALSRQFLWCALARAAVQGAGACCSSETHGARRL